MTTAEILRRAATRVRNGWTQGKLYDAGRVCAVGGIVNARTPDACLVSLYEAEALRMFCRLLQLPRHADSVLRDADSFDAVARWNDLPGQTAENVAAALDWCALLCEEEQAAALRGEPLPLQAQSATSPQDF